MHSKPSLFLIFLLLGLEASLPAFSMGRKRARVENHLKDLDVTWDTTPFMGALPKHYGLCQSDYEPSEILAISPEEGRPEPIPRKILGAALVYKGPGFGASVVGHLGWRLIYCHGKELMDVSFDYTRFGASHREFFKNFDYGFYGTSRVQSQTLVRETLNSPIGDQLLEKLQGSFWLEMGFDPSGTENYGLGTKGNNRTILEFWLKLDEDPKKDEALKLKILNNQIKRYRTQGEKLDAALANLVEGQKEDFSTPIDEFTLEIYSQYDKNCMSYLEEDLKEAIPNLRIPSPFGFLGDKAFLPVHLIHAFAGSGAIEYSILYPSHRLARLHENRRLGKIGLFEKIAPLSKSSKGAHRGPGWILVYPDSEGVFNPTLNCGEFDQDSTCSLWKPYILEGAVNFVAGTLQTGLGIVRTALEYTLFKLPFLNRLGKKLKIPGGPSSVKHGVESMGFSILEIAGFRLRFPEAPLWSAKDLIPIQRNLFQRPVVVNYLAWHEGIDPESLSLSKTTSDELERLFQVSCVGYTVKENWDAQKTEEFITTVCLKNQIPSDERKTCLLEVLSEKDKKIEIKEKIQTLYTTCLNDLLGD